MKPIAVIVIALALLLFGLSSFHRGGGNGDGDAAAGNALHVYCAAGIKKPVEAIAAQYREEFGVDVQLQYGGTGTLLSQIRVAQQGDVFIAADDGTVGDAKRHGIIREVVPLTPQYPVIAVQKGNPKTIQTEEDLFREDVRVAIANPEAASVGKITRRAFGDRWAALQDHVAVMKPTVTELATDLVIGSVDAAILWNSTVPQFDGLESLRVPLLDQEAENVSATILAACERPAAALRFARYLAAPSKGGKVFEAMGFEPTLGDVWAVRPELILYSGGVNRPAVEELLTQFADREGIDITTVFNGCGILCASMKAMKDAAAPKFPDAYYACDLCFVPPVAEEFPEAVKLTETEIGIVVQKGNPKQVLSLADLARSGLRVGLCNAEQSTLGYMTQGMLRSSGLLDSIRNNVSVEVPTADFLVNQMRAGGLDAAVVYRVNYQLQEEHLDFVKVNHEGAVAIQPFSIRKDSPNRNLGERLLEHLLAHREAFEASGFLWRGGEDAVKSSEIEIPGWLAPQQ